MLLTKTQLNKASDKDLEVTAQGIKSEIAKRSVTSKTILLNTMRVMCAAANTTLEELVSKPKTVRDTEKKLRRSRSIGKAKKQSFPKYQHPHDATKTWTGMGRKPFWVELVLNSGGTLDSLLIK